MGAGSVQSSKLMSPWAAIWRSDPGLLWRSEPWRDTGGSVQERKTAAARAVAQGEVVQEQGGGLQGDDLGYGRRKVTEVVSPKGDGPDAVLAKALGASTWRRGVHAVRACLLALTHKEGILHTG